MKNVTIELVEKTFETPYFVVQCQENTRTIKCFVVMESQNFEKAKQEAIEYAKLLRSVEYEEKKTLIEF